MRQGELFDAGIRERFEAFDRENPAVYSRLRELALLARHRNVKVGARLLWERLRWEVLVEVPRRDGDWKLNDHWIAWYARALMEREPELAGYFETRTLRRV